MPSLLLVGCGRMGGAMLTGWQQSHLGFDYYVIDPAGKANDNTTHWSSWDEVPDSFTPDLIMLCVKPQLMPDVLAEITPRNWGKALFLSVAAGRTLTFYQNTLGNNVRFIRIMPNTPCLIGKGMSALCANAHASDTDKSHATNLMQAVGEAVWLDDESLMDAFTALAGSGPAYLFAMIEAMRDAGIAAGLPKEIAAEAAMQTIYGAASLAKESPESPESLREGVTSPGGTTQAGLDVLRAQDGLPQLMERVIARATARGKELA